MSMLVANEFPNELRTQIVDYLDAQSQASLSVVCHFVREKMAAMGVNLSALGSAPYLVDEIFATGKFDNRLSTMNEEESKTLKSQLIQQWFNCMSGKQHINEGAVHFTITDLSRKRNWSDYKIKKLCNALNYNARKQLPTNPYSWVLSWKG